MALFPATSRDQWRALDEFNRRYETVDVLPMLPIACTAPSATAETPGTWSMTRGMPVSWSAAWSKLAWRYARPHRPEQSRVGETGENVVATARQPQASAASSASVCADGSISAASRQRDQTALLNVVTGINAPRSKKQGARRVAARDVCIDAMENSRSAVDVGEL
eukprot:4473740-Pleurochrysis_carterae.AAC.1